MSGTDAAMGPPRLPTAYHSASDGFGNLSHRIPASNSKTEALRPALSTDLQRVGVHGPHGIALIRFESMGTDVHIKVILAGPHRARPPVSLGGCHSRSGRRPPLVQSCHATPSNGRRIAVVVLHRFQIDLKTDWGTNADHRMSRYAPTTSSDGGWVVRHGRRDRVAFRSALNSRSGTSAQRTLPERGALWERYLVILKHRL